MQLRAYQSDLIEKVRGQLRLGRVRVLAVLPTGGGKTPCMCEIMAQSVAKAMRRLTEAHPTILFLAHRQELIEQASEKLDRFGVDHGVIMADHPRHRPHAIVQVASVQTLVRRLSEEKRPKNVTLIIVDEAHHARAKSYQKIISTYPDAIVIGVTATPWRTDGKGLGELFDSLVVGPRIPELTKMGFLVPFDGHAYDKPDLSGVHKVRGDYDVKQLDIAMRQTVLGGSIVRDYLTHAKGKRALAFAVNITHSKAVVAQAIAAGIPAAHVDKDTPDDERKAILGKGGKLERGEILFLSNVGVTVEGTDVPSIECVILMRPTGSLSTALQMMGRGLRPWCFTCTDAPREHCQASGHHVKTICLIHDHANVCEDNGLPDEDFPMDLDMDRPPRPKPIKTCPECKAMFAAGHKNCPRCNHDMTGTDGMAVKRDIKEDGASNRLSIDEIRQRRMARAQELDITLAPLTDQQLMKVHQATQEQKASEYLRLERIREQKGFKPGFSANQYRATFGTWPRFTDEFLADITPATKPFIPWSPRG